MNKTIIDHLVPASVRISSVAGAGCCWLLCAGFAPASTPLVAGEIRQVVATGDRVAAIRGDELLVMSSDGQVIGRPTRADQPTPQPTPRPRPSIDDIVDLYGVPDDDLESDLVSDVLDDEGIGDPGGTGRGRRRADRRGASSSDDARRTPRALAASRDAIWIASTAGLLRMAVTAVDGADPGVVAAAARPSPSPGSSAIATRVGPAALSLSALAATPTGDGLAALAGGRVLRSDDGGASWSLLAILATRARGIAIARDGGDVFVLDDEGIAVVTHRQRIALFEGRARDLVLCGDELLILTDDSLYAWGWDRGLERRTAGLPAQRLTCSTAVAGLIVASGAQLLTSFDGGRNWTPRSDLPLLEVNSVAITPDRLFVGAASGLYILPLVAQEMDAVATVESPVSVRSPVHEALVDEALAAAGPPTLNPRLGAWQGLLPRVSLVVSAASSQASNHPRDTRGAVWFLLTFPLGRARFSSTPPARLAADLLRRRAALAGDLARMAAMTAPAAMGPDDNDEEAAAMMRVVRETLEQLR